MEWVILIIMIFFLLFYKRSRVASVKKGNFQKTHSKIISNTKTYVTRLGLTSEADVVFFAWSSGNLRNMIDVIDVKTNLIDRHFLLMRIVDKTYKIRNDPTNSLLLQKVAEMHLIEFAEIKVALMMEMNGILPRVSTFQQYVTFLTEKGEYMRAIEVCKMAIEHGLHDGTKSGFEGRIKRIKKKMEIL